MKTRAETLVHFGRLGGTQTIFVLAFLLLGLAAPGCRFDPPGLESADASAPDDLLPPGTPGPCGDKAGYIGRAGTDHGYRFVDTALTYDDAFAFCARDNAHLVEIADPAENDFVASRVPATAWIGYDDLDRENRFAWVNGSTAAFTGWASGEPNDSGNEDCTMLRDDGSWVDVECDARHAFVCECEPGFTALAVPACMDDERYDETYRGRRYRFQSSPATWQDAQNSCAADGAHLAVVNDGDENLAASALVFGNAVWIGYTDQTTEGVWQWVTGSESSFAFWELGQPNGGTVENCAERRPLNVWGDLSCTSLRSYICECDPGVNLAP